MSAAAFWLDARIFGMPSMTDSWVSELCSALGCVRHIYPLDVIVILPPLLSPTVRRRVALFMPDDIVGSTSASAAAVSGAVVSDSRLRHTRGARVGWLLAIDGHRDRLGAASIPITLMPCGLRGDPPPVDDVEAPLLEYARKTGAGW